jgi:hypothetical protein
MRAKLLIAVCACALGALGGWFAARQPAPAVADVPQQPANENRPTEVGTRIPFGSVRSLIPHAGMKSLEPARDPAFGQLVNQLRERLENCPYRTAFLVHAPTLYGAVEDALGVFTNQSVLNAIGVRGARGSDPCWAILHLGTYLDCTTVEVTSFTLSQRELTLVHKLHELPETNRRSLPYLYIVPLPPLEAGPFAIRFVEAQSRTEVHSTLLDLQ